ncbi:hypothetical protein L195_g037080, partial [Trifolium pratense]
MERVSVTAKEAEKDEGKRGERRK